MLRLPYKFIFFTSTIFVISIFLGVHLNSKEVNFSGSRSEAVKARIKRVALQTPDLDTAIQFFTEVIGFSLDSKGVIEANADPYLGVIFNIDTNRPFNRALLSTSTEQRGLFIFEQPNMRQLSASESRNFALVVETHDLDALKKRSIDFGIVPAAIISDVSSDGGIFREMLVVSPGGHAILVFEYNKT